MLEEFYHGFAMAGNARPRYKAGMRKIVILGSTGQLAADLLQVFGNEAVGLTHADLDVTDADRVMTILGRQRRDWIINTAAFNRVDDCERNHEAALAVNAFGAYNVARAAAAVGAGVVFFSTDYVFGSENRSPSHPYIEADAPSPVNVYGASKCAGEQLVRTANPATFA